MSTKVAYLLSAIIIASLWYVSEQYQVISQPVGVSVPEPQLAQAQTAVSLSDGGLNQVTFSADISEQTDAIGVVAALNTHSVDLNAISFAEQVFIRKDGQTFFAREVAVEGESHHRSAQMVFEKVARPYQLVARSVAGVEERVLDVN